ncbi:MAG TPA: DUF4326 domain-containing protein [Hyphomicrobiaceae bacterium]|nr:DUF4326 domain-containing protein [Hyphomicrobiaceae bacterium]
MRRSKGWRKPANTVYVGRPSQWGNPFRPGDKHPEHGRPMRRAEAVALYRKALTRPKSALNARLDPRCTLDAVKRELAGRNLACWCSLVGPCHADVLLDIANG